MAIRVSTVFPRGELRYEPTQKWVRAELAGETVVDSHDAWLVWNAGAIVPGYAFPRGDVRTERIADDAVTTYDDPDLAGRVGVRFDAVDRWLEEEEEILGHPRDVFKRIDVRRSSRHVRVIVDGTVVAESSRPWLLFETGLPVRYYLPREDVRMDLLEPTGSHTLCAYKGRASYFSVGDEADIAWFYPDPLPDSLAIRDLVAFYNERADIEVDGERLERPATPWSASR
jgi:uncharacterized protein (DUF427 family)